METGLYLLSKPLTVLSPQVSGSSPSIYSGAKVGGGSRALVNHCISSHLLFWDREGPEGYPQSTRSPKTFKTPSPLPHNSNSYRNTCVSTGNSSSSEAKPRWKVGRGFNSAQRPLLIPLNRLLNFWYWSDEF